MRRGTWPSPCRYATSAATSSSVIVASWPVGIIEFGSSRRASTSSAPRVRSSFSVWIVSASSVSSATIPVTIRPSVVRRIVTWYSFGIRAFGSTMFWRR